MASKNTVKVLVGGKILTLSGYESEEYLQKVGSYLNTKLEELEGLPGYSRQPVETKSTLLSLNIADDYFKAKKQVEIFEQDLHQKDQEMYDLKHELISLQVQLDNKSASTQNTDDDKEQLQKKIKELEQEVDELLGR